MTVELSKNAVVQAYGRWAPIYDVVFGPVFRTGRQVSVRAAERIGGRILEVGVGTGLSLSSYSRANSVSGVDISEPMLAKARRRVARLGLDHVDALDVMDAEHLSFPDASFDVVVAQYVVTAVPHPERALDEFVRVLRPGGELVITSRIGAESGFRGVAEKALMPITGWLGFRTDFPWDRYTRWAAARSDVRLLERRPIPPFGHFSLVRFTKQEAGGAGSPGAERNPQTYEDVG
ncbi:MAG: class I SAM-dependent methyltransferase [Acetobacteraceae bacterium]|nr:class I SAM-dependent methyltransferase [Acetobacteraceae bacterium]